MPTLVAWCVLILTTGFSFASIPPSVPIEVPDGWKLVESRTFTPENLYDYIDGGAELFLEFGFVRCVSLRMTRSGAVLTADLYEMTDPLAALGVYLAKCAPEQPMAGVSCRNSGDRYQLALLQDRWFVFLNNVTGDEMLRPIMQSMAARMADAVPDTPVSLPAPMPEANRVPGSLRLARGPVALQPLATLGPDDILQLKRTHWAVIADYRNEAGTETRIAVRYPDSAAANRAFRWLIDHLDPSLTPVEQGPDRLVFRDPRNAFGEAVRFNRDLVIRLHLKRQPVHGYASTPSHPATGGMNP